MFGGAAQLKNFISYPLMANNGRHDDHAPMSAFGR